MPAKVKFGVIVFPGSNCDADCKWAAEELNQSVEYIWHDSDKSALNKFDVIIVPGGFSYGDYLRSGAIARFARVMDGMKSFSEKKGKYVIGICNGFQILLEAGILPGAMLVNKNLKFICKYINLSVENTDTPFTNKFAKGQVIKVPIAHQEGNYFTDDKGLNALIKNDQIAFRYCDAKGNINENTNPNGSVYGIAGITNKRGNVLGMMPHPERAMTQELGSTDGRLVFESIVNYIKKA
jgi:phosphoribosylformylglycinamidine synthase